MAPEFIGDSVPFDDPEPEPDILEVLLQALVGVRMLAQVEARMGQDRWKDALPLLDDVIKRGTAVLHAQNCQSNSAYTSD